MLKFRLSFLTKTADQERKGKNAFREITFALLIASGRTIWVIVMVMAVALFLQWLSVIQEIAVLRPPLSALLANVPLGLGKMNLPDPVRVELAVAVWRLFSVLLTLPRVQTLVFGSQMVLATKVVPRLLAAHVL